MLPEASDASLPPDPHADALKHALEATHHAEALQRHPQPRTIAEQIDQLPISDHKKQFLRDHPEVLNEAQVMRSHYNAAIAAGVPDDSEAMNRYLLDRVQREVGLRQKRGAETARAATPLASAPSSPIMTVERIAERLGEEADTTRAMLQAADATPIAVTADMPEPPPRRSSIPFSAPVSRDPPSPSGRRTSELRSITLSPAERQIARYSFSSDLTVEERERLYAENKARMLSMRAAGTLNE